MYSKIEYMVSRMFLEVFKEEPNPSKLDYLFTKFGVRTIYQVLEYLSVVGAYPDKSGTIRPYAILFALGRKWELV